jgi:hypothetical protein
MSLICITVLPCHCFGKFLIFISTSTNSNQKGSICYAYTPVSRPTPESPKILFLRNFLRFIDPFCGISSFDSLNDIFHLHERKFNKKITRHLIPILKQFKVTKKPQLLIKIAVLFICCGFYTNSMLRSIKALRS